MKDGAGWRYDDSEEAREAGLENVVDAKILEVPGTAVPGGIRSRFIRGSTFQAVGSSALVTFTKLLWNSLPGTTERYEVPPLKDHAFFDMIDAETTEDLVGLYLQHDGWAVIPSTAKRSTPKYEFLLVHPDRDRQAAVQVKSGHTDLSPGDYEHPDAEIFLFQSRGRYPGEPVDHVTCLSPDTLLDFAKENRAWMPETVRVWLDFLASGQLSL